MHTPFEVESIEFGNLRVLYRTCYRSPNLLALLANPDQDLVKIDYETLKDDGTSTVTVARNLIKKCPIVIKRYNTKNAWHALRRAVRRSRAENYWFYAAKLQTLGVAIAPPIAMIQEYLGAGLKGRSWYLSEFVDGSSFLDHLQTSSDHNMHGYMMERIVATLLLLWEHRITHGDMKENNFLLAQDRVVVLDLDAMKQYKTAAAARDHIRKDRARFLRNWRDHPDLFELARNKLAGQL